MQVILRFPPLMQPENEYQPGIVNSLGYADLIKKGNQMRFPLFSSVYLI
jgi:hypothetical protein